MNDIGFEWRSGIENVLLDSTTNENSPLPKFFCFFVGEVGVEKGKEQCSEHPAVRLV